MKITAVHKEGNTITKYQLDNGKVVNIAMIIAVILIVIIAVVAIKVITVDNVTTSMISFVER